MQSCGKDRKGKSASLKRYFCRKQSETQEAGVVLSTSPHLLETKPAQIIPGIPDDVSLIILAMIPITHRPQCRDISRAWRDALEESVVNSVRCRQGIQKPIYSFCCGEIKHSGKRMLQFQVFDSDTCDLRQLPHLLMPWLQNPFDDFVGFSTLAVGANLLLLDGRVYSQLFGRFKTEKDSCTGEWMFSTQNGIWEPLPALSPVDVVLPSSHEVEKFMLRVEVRDRHQKHGRWRCWI